MAKVLPEGAQTSSAGKAGGVYHRSQCRLPTRGAMGIGRRGVACARLQPRTAQPAEVHCRTVSHLKELLCASRSPVLIWGTFRIA